MPRANRAKVNQAMSNAVASRPKLPPLPDVRELTSMLLDYSRALEPGESFETWLYCEGYSWPDAHWVLGCDQGRWDLRQLAIRPGDRCDLAAQPGLAVPA